VWGDHTWPPDMCDAEALANALCEVFGSSYFEPFLALVQAPTTDMRERLLRRAGAPLDIDEKKALLVASDSDAVDFVVLTGAEEDLKTVVTPLMPEQPDMSPASVDRQEKDDGIHRVPLYLADQLLVDGE
jgi:hypothetical protein